MSVTFVNKYQGLAQGPINHKGSSIINAIFQEDPFSNDRPALIGDAVVLDTGSICFTCDKDSNNTTHCYPRATDPAAGPRSRHRRDRAPASWCSGSP